MNRFKNILRDKILDFKRFLSDNRKPSAFFALLFISFSIFFIVFAEGEITYSVSSITSSIISTNSDVTKNNDTYSMPNLGTIQYEIGYKLTSNSEEITSGPVIIDIFLPSNFDAKVYSGANVLSPVQDGDNENIEINGKKYWHYISNEKDKPISDNNISSNISFASLNDKDNTGIFSPIISVREDSDEFDLSKVNNALDSDIASINISSTLRYQLKSYLGNTVKQENGKYIVPIGVMVYIPSDQIKGSKLPTKLSYDLTLSNSSLSPLNSGDNNAYTENTKYVINGLPYLNNSSVSLSNNTSNSTAEITLSNPSEDNKYNSTDSEIDQESIVLSSNYFLYETTTDAFSELTFNFTVSSKAPNPELYNSKDYSIYSTQNIGKFESYVNFEDSETKEAKPIKSVTYGKDFNFFVTSEYGMVSDEQADSLSNLLTYIKFDENITNLKINLVQMKTGNDDYTDIETTDYNMEYYATEWNSQNFNGASSNMSKNQIMNLFGGPTISSDKLVLKNSSDELGVTIVQFKLNKRIPAGSKIKMSFTGTINDDSNLIQENNKNIQIVTLSKSEVRLSTSSSEKTEFYLGEQKSGNKYVSSIDFANNPDNYNLIQESYDGKNGNTISVVAGTVGNIESQTYSNVNTIDVDTNKNIKVLHNQSEFYSGVDDPFVWRIYSNETIGNQSSVSEITQKILIPKINGYEYLELNNAFLIDKDSLFNEESENIDSNDYTNNTVKCNVNSDSNDSGCSYVVEDTPEGILYTFTLTNTDINTNNINAYLTNGLFFETKIDLIADSSTVNLNVSINHKYNTVFSKNEEGEIVESIDTESTTNTTDISTQIYNLKSEIANSGSLSLTSDGKNRTENLQAEKNFPYYYYMNSVISSSTTELELYYILPYNTDTENNFNGTYQIKIPSLPDGYSAYYLSASENNDYDISVISNKNQEEWKPLAANQSLNNSEVISIKIVKDNNTETDTSYYFGGRKNSILVEITPTENDYGNKYVNTFYIKNGNKIYDTKNSIFSCYNRTIAGLIFEDYDFDGFYSVNENIVKDLPVELYKVNLQENETLNEDDPESYMDNAILINEASYSTDKGFSFDKLESGLYFLKIKFDSEYYNITDYNKEDKSMGSENIANSQFKLAKDSSIALSKVIVLGENDNLNNNINLGLAIKKAFAVDINKYIKNIKVNRNSSTEEYNYDKIKEVKLDFKDLNSTTFEVTYGFDLKNTKYYPGYVGQIVEAIPEEMIFEESLNPGWVKSDSYLYYNALADTLIMPGETYTFEIKLKIPENMAGDFINIISVGDLRILESNDSTANSALEETISTLGETKEK